MAKYKIEIKRSVAKDLRAIPNAQVAMILNEIALLAEEPRPPGSEKLSGLERYRIRHGKYRVVYEINGHVLVVIMVKIAHRKQDYRGL